MFTNSKEEDIGILCNYVTDLVRRRIVKKKRG